MREQLKKLDGILADLRKNKKLLMQALPGHFKFLPVNDEKGNCATTLTLQFVSAEEALNNARNRMNYVIPRHMGKHIYDDWYAIIERRGAAHPLMNPFNMELNKNF